MTEIVEKYVLETSDIQVHDLLSNSGFVFRPVNFSDMESGCLTWANQGKVLSNKPSEIRLFDTVEEAEKIIPSLGRKFRVRKFSEVEKEYMALLVVQS